MARRWLIIAVGVVPAAAVAQPAAAPTAPAPVAPAAVPTVVGDAAPPPALADDVAGPRADDASLPELEYDLFRPVPDELCRPLAIDDTPTTVDAGHLQAEIDVAVVGYDAGDGARTVAAQVMPTRLRLGLTSRVEVQLVAVPYRAERHDDDSGVTASGGYGSTAGRLKVNLWGNDGGRTALAVVPYVGRADGAWAGGLAVPTAAVPVGAVAVAVIPQVDLGPDALAFTTTANVGHPLWGPLLGNAEVMVRIDDAGSPPALQANANFTAGIHRDAEVDFGVRRGVAGDVPDVEGYLRISVRR